MIVFFHFHKAAGSTIVQSAEMMGLRFARSHANGHPLDSSGQPVTFAGKDFGWLQGFFAALADDGVQFISIEWWFPPVEMMLKIHGLTMCTVLRDPFNRAVSNFKMDLQQSYLGNRAYGMQSYLDFSAPHRSHDYYTREICGAYDRSTTITGEHLHYALNFLNCMKAVGCVEKFNLTEEFARIGLEVPRDLVAHQYEPAEEDQEILPLFQMETPVRLKPWFIERNLADYFLYHTVLKS